MKLDPDLPFSSMSVRDYIATHVLAAMIGRTEDECGGCESVRDSTVIAVSYADVLIEELQKNKENHD